MFIKCLPTGMFESNSYIIGNNGTGAVIDAGVDTTSIIKELHKANLKLEYIFLTHAHIDHILHKDELKKLTGAKVLIHEDDAPFLKDAKYNGSLLFRKPKAFEDADILLSDGQILEFGGIELEIIHTPGHTPGGICIKVGNNLFTGDTLFQMSIGRTDLGGGNHSLLIDSIENKLLRLEDDTIVYPGHGPSTTIGKECDYNPYITRPSL